MTEPFTQGSSYRLIEEVGTLPIGTFVVACNRYYTGAYWKCRTRSADALIDDRMVILHPGEVRLVKAMAERPMSQEHRPGGSAFVAKKGNR